MGEGDSASSSGFVGAFMRASNAIYGVREGRPIWKLRPLQLLLTFVTVVLLAAVLVGPYTAVLCLSVVLLVQSLMFADGGVTALGTNIVLMGVVGVVAAWLVFRGLQSVLPKKVGLVGPLAAVAAFVAVPATALAFVGLYAVGGTAPIPLDSLTAAMLGWHTLIGLGEAVITGLAVFSIIAVRPDLVHGARPSFEARTLTIRAGVTA